MKDHLIGAFRRYGLPERIITDRGAPWGVGMEREDGGPFYTELSAWLMRLGIQVSFTARSHPETNGKNERFNGTLQAEVLRFEHLVDLKACQERFKGWRRLWAASVLMKRSAWTCRPAALGYPTGAILKSFYRSNVVPATKCAR